MNELQVVVQQEVGKINWNFEELKAAIVEKVQQYTGVIYDDSVIADAKKDVAELRKIKTSIESRRKEAKAKCLEPYEILEGQVKEITKLIDDPIDMIDRQIKDYEKEQKRKRREEILTYMAETFSELPGSLTEKLKAKIYDSRWENASTTKKSWKEAINAAVAQVKGDLNVLDGIEEDFKDTAHEIYGKNLVLSEALTKVQELRKQKEMILERERQKREREEVAKREALEREKAEAARREALAREKEEVEKRIARENEEASRVRQEAINQRKELVEEIEDRDRKSQEEQEDNLSDLNPSFPEGPVSPIGKAVADIERQAYSHAAVKIMSIQIRGTEEQLSKILAYIKFVGAEYREA